MSLPVVVSRIQNRRGTQAQFNALYPIGYNPIDGYTNGPFGFQPPLTAVTSASGTGTVATLIVGILPSDINVGSQIVVAGVGSGYDGNFLVTNIVGTAISYASSAIAVLGAGGTLAVPYNPVNYPNVLMPGELALCTDTGNIFLGNLNGTYLEISQAGAAANISLAPVVLTLAPAGSPTVIPQLSYVSTPFFTILYDLADSGSADWNTIGTNYGRNGQLQITAVTSTALLTDTCTEINLSAGDIFFIANIVGADIQISYTSTLPYSVTFSTSTLNWLPF